VVANRRSPVYDLHVYPSKKPHSVLAALIEHFTVPGETVLDPLCGSGGTLYVARTLQRNAIGFDLSPLACWLAEALARPYDAVKLQAGFDLLQPLVRPELERLYSARCPVCGGPARTRYWIHSAFTTCPEGKRFAWSNVKDRPVCPDCGAALQRPRFVGETEPVAWCYECLGGCKPKLGHLQRYDSLGRENEAFAPQLEAWRKALALEPPAALPELEFPFGKETQRLFRAQLQRLPALFTRRNWYALNVLMEGISKLPEAFQPPLKLAFSAALLGCTRMATLSNGNTLRGTYYVPPVQRENNVWNLFVRKVHSLVKGLEQARSAIDSETLFLVGQADATQLPLQEAATIDYVLSDPPYAGNVQYSELNFLQSALAGLQTTTPSPRASELTVNPFQSKALADWQRLMQQVLSEVRRVLKPGRFVSLFYQNGDWQALFALQEAVRSAGLEFPPALPTLVITGQRSYNQINTSKLNKRDLVFHFRKPTGRAAYAPLASEAEVKRLVRAKRRKGLAGGRLWDEVTGELLQAGRLPAVDLRALIIG